MPRTKSLNHYPDRYSEIVRECAVQGKTVKLAALPRAKALSIRGHWYAYVGSLKAEAARIRKKAPESLGGGDLDLLALESLQASVMVQIEDLGRGEARVVFQSREHSWQAAALRNAEVVQTESQPTGNLDEEAMRLLGVQATVDKGEENGDS